MKSDLKTGLSGCKLELFGNSLVKTSSCPSYNKRLLEQARKQIFFSNFQFKNIDSPKVFSMNGGCYQKESELYYFEMEYVSGYSFKDYLAFANTNQILFIYESLCEYFDFLISQSNYYKAAHVRNKVVEKMQSFSSVEEEFLKFVLDYSEKVDFSSAPKTFCHGDLTFSNMIFRNNRIFFIDFLDSYLDSFLLDLVKLKQDLYYGWSIETQDIPAKDKIRIWQTFTFLWKKLEKKYYYYINLDAFKVMDAINYFRIEPYLTNDHQRFILKSSIRKLELYEEFNRANGGKV